MATGPEPPDSFYGRLSETMGLTAAVIGSVFVLVVVHFIFQIFKKMQIILKSLKPDGPVIQIILIGRSGSGKSSSGNTILGRKNFEVHKQKVKHQAGISDEVTQIAGKKVAVIDCPDLLDPDLTKEQLEMLKEQLLSQCSAGLSAVLLTVPLEEPLQNEEEILYYMKFLFGPEVQKYTMILFTRGDELEELHTIDEYLQHEIHADLQLLVTECGGKLHCFNNKSKSVDQKQQLLQKIEGIMEENGGNFIMPQFRRRESRDIPDVNFSGQSPAGPDVTDGIPEKKDLRLVLLGKTGAGKSATANTIIGRKVFESTASPKSQTRECQSETTVRFGKEISVIDTPGLYDTELSKDEVQTELVKCITYASPGPHAFIIVIRVGRFTEEEKNTIKELKVVFGEKIEKYAMILFTHKDQLEEENKTFDQFLLDDTDLKKLVQSCGNRFFCLSNTSASFPQFKGLIRKIETMVAENGGTHFSNDMFEGTEKCIQEIQKQKLDEKVKQSQQVPQSEWQKIYWRLVEESRREAEISFSSTLRAVFNRVRYLVYIPIALIAEILQVVEVKPAEEQCAIKEAESLGLSHIEAVTLAIRATGKLSTQKMCVIQ